MKICLGCSGEILSENWTCKSCNWEPKHVDGVIQFAPNFLSGIESYDPDWYNELASLEEKNFWFTARNRLIKWLSTKYIKKSKKYLEVGCGTGFVLKMMRETFPDLEMYATELQPSGINFTKNRNSQKITFFQMDACQIPFRNEFDVVGAFDVIEHIPDDVKAINEIYASLKSGGLFILTVPQHMFLWSKYDELGFHFRRYSAKELKVKLEDAGFKILKSTSFNSILLPIMILSRYLKRSDSNKEVDVMDELRIPSWVNFILSRLLLVEFVLSVIGISWPVGGSRVVVAKKAVE